MRPSRLKLRIHTVLTVNVRKHVHVIGICYIMVYVGNHVNFKLTMRMVLRTCILAKKMKDNVDGNFVPMQKLMLMLMRI